MTVGEGEVGLHPTNCPPTQGGPRCPSTHQAQSSQWAAGPGTRSHTPGSHLWRQVRRRDSHTEVREQRTPDRGREPQKGCGHSHTGGEVGRMSGPGEGRARGRRPLTQRCVGTLLTLGDVHIVLPRRHYRKAQAGLTQGLWADTRSSCPAPDFQQNQPDSSTDAQSWPQWAQREAGRVLTGAASGLKEANKGRSNGESRVL